MPDQNAESSLSTTPIHVDRHKNTDPNRNPDTSAQPLAEQGRKNAMTDCPETTVLIRLSQFHEQELDNMARDFDDTHNAQYAEKVWWALHGQVGTMPTQPELKKAWKAVSEKALSNAWESVDREYHLVPEHFLHISDSHYESTDESLSKVDGSFIDNVNKDTIRQGYPNWPEIEMLVEFKRGGTGSDPFDDIPLHDPDATAKTRTAVRGQLMSYAERLFSYQHRQTVFFLLVNSDRFRVMRWDRSGVVVTEAIDYISTMEGTKALLEVLYAFTKLRRALQGIDTTAARLKEDSCGWQRMDVLARSDPHDLDYAEGWLDGPVHEVFWNKDLAAKFGCITGKGDTQMHYDPTCRCAGHKKPPPVIPVLSHVRQMFRDSLVEGFPRYRLMVDGQEYLVAKHVFLASGLVGRGTRGYVALEWKTQQFVFLKDCWRPAYEGVAMEAEILSKLNKSGVSNVPTVVRYGDVYDTEGEDKPRRQETEASRFHPERGDKKVNVDLPPFAETVKPPPEVKKKLERFVKEAEIKPKIEDADAKVMRSAPLPIPADAMVVVDSDASTDPPPPPVKVVKAAASAPKLGAFGSDTDVPSTPKATSTVRGKKRKFNAFLAAGKRKPGAGLRHMAHTRMVVREVCLPLTAFTNSQQFVRILVECITAHAMAYEKCKYIHRDISAGNLLIWPQFIRREDGKCGVFWRGLLADWEMAKHSGTEHAMQPQRTGTWHFMSAYLLLNPGAPTSIADELEAFLHVLIYGCVRRVRSNLPTIHAFLNDYFAGGSFDPLFKQAACPPAKRESVVDRKKLKMTTRAVVFETPTGKQDHPLNALIKRLIAVFHSRYAVLEWESSKTTVSPSSPSPRDKYNDPEQWDSVWTGYQAFVDTSQDQLEEDLSDSDEIEVPTPKMYDNAAALKSHGAILRIFSSFAKADKWPADDVVPDRQAEPRAEKDLRQAPAAGVATKRQISPIPEAEEPEDVPVPHAEVHRAEGSDLATARKTLRDESVVPSERPRKRRRIDPVVQEAGANILAQAVDLDVPTRRVTRSRSAAIAAAAPVPVPAPAPAPQLPSRRQAVAATAPSTRVTRSRSGKLPTGNTTGGRAGASASSSEPRTRRGGRSRTTVSTAAAPSRPKTRGRAEQSTANSGGGRRTRRK